MSVIAKIIGKPLSTQISRSARNVVRAINSQSTKAYNGILRDVSKKLKIPTTALRSRRGSYIKRASSANAVFEALTRGGKIPWRYSKYAAKYVRRPNGRPRQIVKFNRLDNGIVIRKTYTQTYFGVRGVRAPLRQYKSGDDRRNEFRLNQRYGVKSTADKRRTVVPASRTPLLDVSERSPTLYNRIVLNIYTEWIRLDKAGV